VPGGFGREIAAGQAARLLARITPADPAARARHGLPDALTHQLPQPSLAPRLGGATASQPPTSR
jgi:hypothetical protein